MDGAKTPAHEAHPANNIVLENEREEPEEGKAPGLNVTQPQFVTAVVSEYTVKRCHHRVLFGAPTKRVLLARRRGHLRVRHEFAAGSRFILDLWRRNEYGTLQWSCYVAECGAPGQVIQSVPFVIPGARVLLFTRGAAQSKAFLAWLYDLNHRGIDPLHCPAETFEAVHFRLHGRRSHQWQIAALNGTL